VTTLSDRLNFCFIRYLRFSSMIIFQFDNIAVLSNSGPNHAVKCFRFACPFSRFATIMSN